MSKHISKDDMSAARIQLHLNVHEPIELVEMTLSFQAMAYEYKKYLAAEARRRGNKPSDNDIQLYITKIESNCILAELGGAISLLGTLFPVMNAVNVFCDFTRNMQKMMDWFKEVGEEEKVSAEDIPYTKTQCSRAADFLKIVAGSKDANLGLRVIEYDEETTKEGEKEISKVHLTVDYSSEDAYKARKGALIAKNELERTGDADYKNVLMYFFQTNTDDPKSAGKTGDMAVIKTINKKPLPVYFVSDLDQQKVTYIINDVKLNPLKMSFNVDVNVETDRNDKPRFFRVVKINDYYPDEDT